MRIAVFGAGGVGCYFGGLLARAGHAVTLIGRPLHVEAVLRDGLLVDTQSLQAHVRVEASTDARAVRSAKLVLVCVKSTDTERAAAEMAGHLEPDALVLSLQNGVDNAERLQAALRQEVAPAVVYVATEMAGPGHVQQRGGGELVVGAGAARHDVAGLFAAAGVPVHVSDDIAGALWAKLIVNCAYNALSAITRQPYGRLAESQGAQSLMHEAVQECLAVARASGVIVPGDPWEAVQGIARAMPAQLSSTAQDLACGKKSEIDHLNGYVACRGAALGIATPINRALHSLVKLLEAREAVP